MSPTPFTVARSTSIAAPAAEIYPHIVDFRKWTGWSPYEGMDPNLARTYSGPASGPRAHYAWSGNRKAGTGTMEITEVAENSSVTIALTFTKPFKAQNTCVFTLTPNGESTTVEWAMSGENSGFGKVFALLMPMDKLVGKDFEKGLSSLKAVVEGA